MEGKKRFWLNEEGNSSFIKVQIYHKIQKMNSFLQSSSLLIKFIQFYPFLQVRKVTSFILCFIFDLL
jgi:hypothetical protein